MFVSQGNKGGVSIRLSFYGHTLCFLNCHLAAHMKYATERVDEFERIMDSQTFECKKAPRIVDHRLVFWFGDLNFRIQDHGMHFVRTCINNQTYNLLWSKDQPAAPLLTSCGKKRKPAWTDRILWRLRSKVTASDEQDGNGVDEKKVKQQLEEDEEYPLKIRQDLYTSNMEYSISDHKPVISIFTLELRKMFETPLVRLQPEGDWSADIDAMVLYSPLQPFPSSAWDWIGLYKVGFSSISDYITYTWVKDDEVAFNEEIIQVHESKVAIEEGLVPERLNGLDKAVAVTDLWRTMSVPELSPMQNTGPNLVNMEVMRNHSELFRAECMRLIVETDKACKRMQNDDNKRLDQRVRDIQKKRLPSERLHDDVDRELLKEREVIEGVASLLQRVVEQITEQIRLNRSAKYYLEQDLKEKFEAQCIDNSCSIMTTSSVQNQRRPRNPVSVLPCLSVTPKQWENISEINISKAAQQKTNSLSLQALVESLLEQTAADMQKQVQVTTEAFQLNVQQIKSAKSQMEDQLSKTLLEFSSQQKIKEDLTVAIADNQNFLDLAQARLELRRHRPAKEQCCDPAQTQLLAEVQQLTAHINRLHGAVAQSEEQQRALIRCQLELQENIEIKASSLYIDEVICTQHREPITIHAF
ncbi:hypothetical protein INR49_032717 [Caranx melampygus]|nr:hypothetical protein INR49_032717 [Caranx melampygus]